MKNRRHFLKQFLATSAGTALASQGLIASSNFNIQTTTAPIAIATWKNPSGVGKAGEILQTGGKALDAIEQGIRIVEADSNDLSVGYGGLPDRNGDVTLDACIMDENDNAGSVTYLQNIMHPISVARDIMEHTPHVMLSGKGAHQFAREMGHKKENLLTSTARQLWQKWKREHRNDAEFVQPGTHDTVGMLALDSMGNLSGGCSSSGWAYKLPGRVGDSPIIGAGLFVDNEVGAATATGLGELVMKTMGSFLIVELMRQGRTAQEACEEALQRIIVKYPKIVADGHQVGYLALRKDGQIGAYSIQKEYSYTLHNGTLSHIQSPYAK